MKPLGLPPADKRKVIQGIFWIVDNVAKWKDLPVESGSDNSSQGYQQRKRGFVT